MRDVTPGLWEGLADADGAGLRHNYGTAGDVPGLLRRCAGADRADAEAAAYDLENVLFHQGGWICPAAPAALSFCSGSPPRRTCGAGPRCWIWS
ncbi:hypothetical protein AA958_11780 [Streptomyces sp. CNQ-509]|uniref:hypothetical protein n=1 Tax=Streptomyces sp. CNQ-509 TaxID=444103 RepID=UPI00062DE391|nr:hypothetical protein [Streptomyces sp. CNQ-509]AKH82799.1 hypothetical protein AA958_11780 [Streptomyces sp. CNQ-509]